MAPIIRITEPCSAVVPSLQEINYLSVESNHSVYLNLARTSSLCIAERRIREGRMLKGYLVGVRAHARDTYVASSRESSHEYRVETTGASPGILESGIRG